MSELVHMRHRMKAVKTIQKITRAMCLVSMSTHTRFRNKKQFLEIYHNSLKQLFNQVHQYEPDWQDPLFSTSANGPELVIIIGAQKGLCGTFNTALATFCSNTLKAEITSSSRHIIIIGTSPFVELSLSIGTIVKHINSVSLATLANAAQECIQFIFNTSEPYAKVTVLSNYSKTFFTQRPQATSILPFNSIDTTSSIENDFVWEQTPPFLLSALARQLLEASLQRLIFESLLAEQAARFIAMDAATRNAHSLLTSMKLTYNKIRQAKITRELTDLVGSFF